MNPDHQITDCESAFDWWKSLVTECRRRKLQNHLISLRLSPLKCAIFFDVGLPAFEHMTKCKVKSVYIGPDNDES